MAGVTAKATYTEQTVYTDTAEMLGVPYGRLRSLAERHGVSLASVIRHCVRHGITAAERVPAGAWADVPQAPPQVA